MTEPARKIINWRFSKPQTDFFASDKFASLYVGGWGSGKTWVGARKAFKISQAWPDSLGLISANTVKQLHQSTLVEFWKALREDFHCARGDDYVYSKAPPKRWGIESRFAEHNGVITFRWGSQIVTRSLSKFEYILGLTLGWAWIDEARDAKKAAFEAVLSRLRCNRIDSPRLDITTSPNGFDWLYEYFETQRLEHPELNTERCYFVGSTKDNEDNLPDNFIHNLETSLDPRLAEQNIQGRWVDVATGRAYYAFSRELNVSDAVAFNPNLPVYLCCDFNATPMSWVIAQPWRGVTAAISKFGPIKLQNEGLLVVDEIVIERSSTPEALDEFVAREYGINPGNVTVYGDASGHHGTVGQSDYSIIKKAGFGDVRVKKKNPTQIDRVNAVNAMLTNGVGATGILIHPRCKELIRDLSQVGLKPGTRQIDKKDPARTHTSDALGYCIADKWPVKRNRIIQTKGNRF